MIELLERHTALQRKCLWHIAMAYAAWWAPKAEPMWQLELAAHYYAAIRGRKYYGVYA